MNTKKILSIALAFTVALVSCKKKEAPVTAVDVNYTGAPLVNFYNYDGYDKVNVELLDKWVSFDYDVKLSNTTEPAKQAITVTIQKDDNPIAEYNTLNGTNFINVPQNAFKVENWEVVIPKGARKATFHFEVNPARLNLANSYAVGFSILKVSGGGAVVNSNDVETRMMVELGTLNDYDGVYEKRSFFSHPTNLALGGVYGIAAPYDPIYMITSGPTSVDSYIDGYAYPTELVVNWSTPAYTYFTAVNPRFTVNPATNAVTASTSPVTASPGSQAVIEQNTADRAVSKYYPTGIPGFSPNKKTIVVHFRWSVPTDRVARDTFVFLRKR